MPDDQTALAVDAFFYGYPLVANLTEVTRFVAHGMGATPPTPLNTFGHATTLATPADTFVTINNDTVYSIAPIDLSAGPLILHVPDTAARYYVLQFIDAWTNNFAYLGTRATGTAEAHYLIVPPGWAGEVPAGMQRITAPSRVLAIVGRFAVTGEADLPNVAALQQDLTLRPLTPGSAPPGVPVPDTGVPAALAFWEQLRVWMQAFPPAPPDQDYQQRFAPLGLLDAASPYVDPAPERAALLTQGLADARAKLEAALTRPGALTNGWNVTLHVFDYNLDFFELGSLDDPQWKLASRAQAYLTRTLAARAGLWGNHAYEALYALTFVDSDGQQLNGAHRYRLELAPPPPVGAFWSLTMYDVPRYYLVENPIKRYSIGDRTLGIVYHADGSLTLYLQHAPPDDATQRANWLPTPAGDFRPALRMYQPDAAVLDGTWQPPAIERLA